MDRPIRVVQFFHTYNIEYGGGLTRFAIELGRRLDPQEFQTIFCSMGKQDQGSKPLRHQLTDEGYTTIVATDWIDGRPYRSLYNAIASLRSRFTQDPVDIIHSHSQFTDLALPFLKLQGVNPVTFRTVHYGFVKEWRNRSWMRAIFTNFLVPIIFDQEIGINQANTDRLNQRWMARLCGRKAIKIYNAIDIDTITRSTQDPVTLKSALGIPLDVPVIGTIGRLEEQKGYPYLLEAIHRLKPDLPQLYALIIGNGPSSTELNQQARDLGIAERVIFTGNRPDICNLLGCMDLFVSSSLWEGLPTVVLESMANRVPVLATDIPGTNELVQHDINGWLVEPASSESIANGIQKLLSSPDLRTRLSDQGAKKVEDFSIEAIAKEHEELYRLILGK